MQYEAKLEDFTGFADYVGIKTKQKGDELTFQYCPYCRDSISKDDEWKFAINTKSALYGCLRASCLKAGHFRKLAKDFGYKLNYEEEQQYRHIKQPEKKIVPRESAIAYLVNRGISKETVERYEITALEKQPHIMVFPFFNEYGKLEFIKYRNMKFRKGRDKNKEWCEEGCKPILFGMKQCTDFGTLIITEGQIDSLSVAQAGFNNAVSVPTGARGFTWFSNCYDWINRFDTVIVFGDMEKGHMTLLDELLQRLPNKVKAVRKEDYMGEKDANDILRSFGEEAIADCINNAQEPGIDYVIELADVKRKNDDDELKIKTGFFELDEALRGGIRCGQLFLLTGKTGEGKSTFASQVLAEALDQGIKVFAYSGELDNEDFQDCLNSQLAGDEYMTGKENEFNKMDYYLDENTERQIKDWYRGRALIYDNNRITIKERPKLLDIVRRVVTRKGVQLVLIDNLMTAMEFVKNQNDLYLAQTNFVAELKEISQQYHVAIILIAHPRKTGKDQEDDKALTNDDVAGSSNIGNLPDIVASYDRAADDKDYDSVFQLTKNRKTGRLRKGKDSIHMNFSAKSKRITGERCLQKQYGWVRMYTDVTDEIDVPF